MKCYRSGGCGPYEMYPENECRKMIGHSQTMTNADKIRHMTDEELAEWLVSHDKKCFLDGHLSKEGYMHWLKQEVESDG